MDLDRGRQIDLQELKEARKTASPGDVKKIDQSMNKILREAPTLSTDRQRLINAVRSGDERGAKQLRQEIDRKSREMNGYGW